MRKGEWGIGVCVCVCSGLYRRAPIAKALTWESAWHSDRPIEAGEQRAKGTREASGQVL